MRPTIRILGRDVFSLPRKERAERFTQQFCEDVAHLLESSRMEDARYDKHSGMLFVIIDPREIRKELLGKKVKYLALLNGNESRPVGLFVVEGDCDWELEISDFFIRREYRNRGLGTQMMKKFLAQLKKDYKNRHATLRLNVKLGNDGAERFYNRFGFSVNAKQMKREM